MFEVNWGFLGAGHIAHKALAPATHNAKGAKIYAVASRDEKRSAELGGKVVHTSYDDLLNDDKVDAVYISLANHQHLEWTIKALNAGKHVLCEKPLGLDVRETKLMFDAAEKNNRLLVEAVWTRWHPRFKRMKQLIDEGAIGKVKAINTGFTFIGDVEGNYRNEPAMGGGALYDIGCYEIHSWIAMSGGVKKFKVKKVKQDQARSGIDSTTWVKASINNSIKIQGCSSFDFEEYQNLEITGSKGRIKTGLGNSFGSWNEASSLILEQKGRLVNVENFPVVDAYQLMVEEVSARIKGGDNWVLSPADSIKAAEILDQIAAG